MMSLITLNTYGFLRIRLSNYSLDEWKTARSGIIKAFILLLALAYPYFKPFQASTNPELGYHAFEQ